MLARFLDPFAATGAPDWITAFEFFVYFFHRWSIYRADRLCKELFWIIFGCRFLARPTAQLAIRAAGSRFLRACALAKQAHGDPDYFVVG